MQRRPTLERCRLAAAAILALLPSSAPALVGPSGDAEALSAYVVMVLNHVGRTAGYCSGLVIASTVVLTAAHCVPQGADVKVHFRDGSGTPVLLDVAEIERHPGFRANAIKTRERSIDLAMVRLTQPLPDRFRPAAFGATEPAAVGTRYRLVGFGLTREGDPTSSGQLRVATVAARAPLSSVLLWAEDADGHGTGACTGDSGGPVLAAEGETAVALMVWSAGTGKAQCGALTQAVWLTPQKDWIEGILTRWGVAR